MQDGKVIIAGGSGLIGTALIEKFTAEGVIPINVDIRHGDSYFNMQHPGSIDGVLNSNKIGAWVNCTYPRDLKTATEGWLTTTRKILEHMAIHGDGGVVVNFGSIYGMVASTPELYEDTDMTMPEEYAFVKGGIIACSRDLARKYGKYGIRIHVVSPGGVWNHQDPRFVRKYEQKTPLGRMASPEDIAGLVYFLCTDEANYMTGNNIQVDGGFTA